MNFDKFVAFFRKYVEPFMVIGVLIMAYFIFAEVRTGVELREEISQNCGWGNEDYRCFCEKGKALEIKEMIDNDFKPNISIGDIEYVPMSG